MATDSKKQAKQLLANACELSGGVMTTVVHGFGMDGGKLEGEYYVAPIIRLSDVASMRICLTPNLARQLAEAILSNPAVRGNVSKAPAGPGRPKGSQSAEMAAEVAALFAALEADRSLTAADCASRFGITMKCLHRRLRTADLARHSLLGFRRGRHDREVAS